MTNALFVLALATFFSIVFSWGFRKLPRDDWQFMATVPMQRLSQGSWRGLNLTYYGFFNASACVFSCAMVILLMGSIDVPLLATLGVVITLLLVCIPAAKIVARLVEGKRHTFTVAGASFIGFTILPLLVPMFNNIVGSRFGVRVPFVQMLAAIAIAYAFGEALGRLACISFGCCYGKLIWHVPAVIQRTFGNACFIFWGDTKKAAYESELSGQPLVPIQAVTAVISTFAGLVGVLLFLSSQWVAALLVPVIVTQVWRALSETLRADYRGGGRISAYQLMALGSLAYALVVLTFVVPTESVAPNLVNGLQSLTSTAAILILEGLWVAVFLYLGRSSVTMARMSFHVVRERV